MDRLAGNHYGKAAPVFQSLSHHLAVSAILEGRVAAAVFVNDSARPTAALTWNKHRFYLAGSSEDRSFNEDLHCLFIETIVPQALQAGNNRLMLYYAPGAWEGAVADVILREWRPVKSQRQFYAFHKAPVDWRGLLPEGFRLRAIDGSLLNASLFNRDALMEEMCSERASVEEFLEKSFGVCVTHGDEIVGWCLSEYNSADRCEIGIETLDSYQRRGLATAMTLALAERAASQGISQIGWHCFAGNVPSVATALRAGFKRVADYPVFLVRIGGE
jgi:RimJ/RimL family protein N-acetyltransferase